MTRREVHNQAERGETPKIKARSCRVLYEVGEFGDRLPDVEAAAS